MIDLSMTEKEGIKWLTLKGRLDSMSSPEIQQKISDLTLSGERRLIVDFREVSYISSAGLRMFLIVQKQLNKVSGELILYNMSPSVFEVFRVSGFVQLFQIVSSEEEIKSVIHKEKTALTTTTKNVNGISIQYVEKETSSSSLFIIGSQEKLATAEYGEEDVVSVAAERIQFGTGLATLGEDYKDYKNFFGETVVIDRNFFYYPSVKRPVVDFMIHSQQSIDYQYRFFHGFGFNGEYKYFLSFKGTSGFVELTNLIEALFKITSDNLLGIVFLAESKGFWGMHLKHTPIMENKPSNVEDIFSHENFTEWMNFPVEATDNNNIIAGTGIAIKDKNKEQPEIQELFSKGNNFHIHAGIFEKQPLNKNIDVFESELRRVVTELEVYKIQHVLGQTQFSSGMIGLVQLKG